MLVRAALRAFGRTVALVHSELSAGERQRPVVAHP